MKKICICILSILTVLNIQLAWAGTDDSGLQVFTVDFSKQLGESADVVQEDTLLSPYCYNLFSSGNGLCSFPQPKGSGYEWTGAGVDIVDSSFGDAIVRADNGSASDIFSHINPSYAAPSMGARVLLTAAGSTSDNSELFAFQNGSTAAVFVGSKIITITGNHFAPTTTEVALPSGTGRSAAIWQNRFFYSYSNYIYYSAPQDFFNFTSSSTAGGVIRLYEDTSILKIVSTKYGLYVFASSGIWLLSGSSKNAWSLDKISNILLPDFDMVTVYNDVVYFKDFRSQGQKIWSISGVTVSLFAEVPYKIALAHQMRFVNSGKFLILASPTTNGTGYVYDVARKTFFETSEYNGLGSNWYFLKRTSTGYKIYELPLGEVFTNEYDGTTGYYVPVLYPWAYQTAWTTLDGNSGTRKEIDRIEIDYQGGTTSVVLYYTYGNGSFSYGTTTLTAPTNSRMTTYTWNAPIGRQQSNRFSLYFLSSGTQTMTINYILKQARIYYRNIGNYKNNNLR